MKINNKTNWNTKQLGALIRKVAEHEQMTAEEMDKLHVIVKYRKRSSNWRDNQSRGWARYSGTYMCLSVVKGVEVDKVDMAHTIAHELAHCQGVHHSKAMRGPRYGWAKGYRDVWAWAADFPLTMNADSVKEKPKGVDLAVKKLEHCQAQVLVWQKKMKMAQTKMKKWNAKVRYYEGRMAALTPSPEVVEPLFMGQTSDH